MSYDIACLRCGRALDPRDGVRVPRDADAVTDHHGLPDVPTITVCYGCKRPGEKYWSACE